MVDAVNVLQPKFPFLIMANVILLRSPAQDAPDTYEESFKSFGYRISSVPVLETASINLNALKRILLSTQNYNGVVVTSARAGQTWKTVVRDILLDGSVTEGG
jgi:uroporphyrinogen-III synthase